MENNIFICKVSEKELKKKYIFLYGELYFCTPENIILF